MVEFKFNFACGLTFHKLTFHRNTVNCKKVMSLIVEAFASFDKSQAAKKIFCSNLYNRRARKL